MATIAARVSHEKTLLWGVFIVYLVLAAYTISHHEMWGDEVHSWNIAKGSQSYADLIANTRFEGHPPVWYTILWIISKCTHDLDYVQMAHWLIASLTVMAVLFFSPMHLFARILVPFGYFFLYEYSALSRNYAIGILLACCICIIIRKTFRFKIPVYYLLLFLMSNTHLLAIVLAGCLHLYFLIFHFEHRRDKSIVVMHILLGIAVFLPSLYFIFPPQDSQLNAQYWIQRWNAQQLKAVGQAPLRSFLPIPAWWTQHMWNTHFLLDSPNKSKLLNLVIALIPLTMAIFVLKRNKKSLVVFLSNLCLSFLIAFLVFPLTSGRYAGFLFIGFVVSYWLFCHEVVPEKKEKWLVNCLLFVQVIAGIMMVNKDIRLPFSNANKVTELMNLPPRDSRVVTDYWAMNAISAFADRPVYCIDIQREISYVLWGPELGNMLKRPYRYFDGFTHLFQQESIDSAYMISTGSPDVLKRVDKRLFETFRVELIDKREGAIEKGGNIYLYAVRTRWPISQ